MTSSWLILWMCSLILQVSVNGDCIRHVFQEGTVVSDNYPNGYQRGLKCRSWIHAPTGKVVDISVVDLDVGASSSGGCLLDSVRLYDGYRSTDPLLATLCGSVTSGSYRTTQTKAYIAFKTDRLDDGGTGYNFTVAFVDPNQGTNPTTTTSTTTTATTPVTTTTTPVTTTTTPVTTTTTPISTTTTPITTTTTPITTTTTPITTTTTPITTTTTPITTTTTPITTTTTPITTTTTPITTTTTPITTTTTPISTTTTSVTTTPSTTASGNVPNWQADSCGRSPVADAGSLELLTPRVYGGVDAMEHEFPWMVLIMRNNILVCGGSVINSNWIVTAAHCGVVSGPEFSLIVGAHSLRQTEESTRQTLQPIAVYTNPNYDSSTHDYDIALIRTNEAILLNDYVQPICPPNVHETFAHRKAIVAGWGRMLDESGRPTLPSVLQYTSLNITTMEYCRNKWRGHGVITDRMVCASDNRHGTERDTCQGDSGGPMVVKRADNSFVIVGITSFGIGCASGYPGVYSRVSYLLNWMQDILDEN